MGLWNNAYGQRSARRLSGHPEGPTETQLFTEQLCLEHLLCVRYCSECGAYAMKKTRSPGLMEQMH